MDELLVWLIVIGLAVAAAVLVLWIVVATIVRIFAWVLVLWITGFAVGLGLGILVGVVLPPRVLLGKAGVEPKIAEPELVVTGKVLGKAPRGAAAHFGWDRAWPVYNPHQAKRDAWAVLGQTGRLVRGLFGPMVADDPWPVRTALLLPPFAGFAVGAWLSIAAWSLVMGVLGGIVYLVQELGVLAYRWHDRLTRRRRKATLRCAKCYRVTLTPTYRCANTACTNLHHDVTPGPLGIIRRRCGCGTSIPTTVRAAARHLVTVCPYCLENVPAGSGTRRVLPVPVIGAVGAGKTQFLSSGVVELEHQLERLSGALTPISPVAEDFVKDAQDAITSGRRVMKTEWKNQPEGVPLILTFPGRELELQLMDAAGENFVDWERSRALGYIDTADVLFFLLDPLALPEMRELLRITDKVDTVPVALGDPQDSYASVVDRLRAEDVRLSTKSLAIILTKVDVLRTLPGAETLTPGDGDSIRRWMTDNGADSFVRRVDQDFKRVSYFAVDSYGRRDALDALHPIRVIDWALQTAGTRVSILPQPPAVADENEKEERAV